MRTLNDKYLSMLGLEMKLSSISLQFRVKSEIFLLDNLKLTVKNLPSIKCDTNNHTKTMNKNQKRI